MVEGHLEKIDWGKLEAFCKNESEYKEAAKMLGNMKNWDKLIA